MVEFTSVASSNIQGMHYDDATQVLTVEFVGGARYRYTGVEQDEYDGLMSAASKGSYFADNIKNSYPYASA